MEKNQKQQMTLSDHFTEMQKLIEKFNKDYERTLKNLKKKLEVTSDGRNERGRNQGRSSK